MVMSNRRQCFGYRNIKYVAKCMIQASTGHSRWALLQLTNLLFIFFSAHNLFAGNIKDNQLEGVCAYNEACASKWRVNVAPYLWAINMNGRVQSGPLATHLSQSFTDIMKHFDGGGMLWIDASRDPFGFFANIIYTVLHDHGESGRLHAHMQNNFAIFSAGLSYLLWTHLFNNNHFAGQQNMKLETYLGARVTSNMLHLRLNDLALNNDHRWTDPLVGLRFTFNLNSNWHLVLDGDVGGTNHQNHYSYNVMGLVGFQPQILNKGNVITNFYFGYRELYQVYDTGRGIHLFRWHMRLFGPLVGVNFSI